MARDEGLEEVLRGDLRGLDGLAEKGMFGGRAFLLRGNLLCGAREDGVMVRLGAGRDAWALALDGVAPLLSGGRPMAGWVRVAPSPCADDTLRRRFLDAALDFAGTLPPK